MTKQEIFHKILVSLSFNKEHPYPEWKRGKTYPVYKGKCICTQTGLVRHFELINEITHHTILVGSECVKKFNIDDLTEWVDEYTKLDAAEKRKASSERKKIMFIAQEIFHWNYETEPLSKDKIKAIKLLMLETDRYEEKQINALRKVLAASQQGTRVPQWIIYHVENVRELYPFAFRKKYYGENFSDAGYKIIQYNVNVDIEE